MEECENSKESKIKACEIIDLEKKCGVAEVFVRGMVVETRVQVKPIAVQPLHAINSLKAYSSLGRVQNVRE
ncbi:unnamed protein product [Sphenostylis stenocarpa]|uniref:Uncharacterized protein n=1 Tax=Sphenostylis stenocarpa TaxID=92480 RepID=A0AA86SRB1_9FABA|nr:unnamed protein product [Sphenostylis stenocarpa]